MSGRGRDVEHWDGSITHYDEDGKMIGESRPSLFGLSMIMMKMDKE